MNELIWALRPELNEWVKTFPIGFISAAENRQTYEIKDGTAIIQIHGILLKGIPIHFRSDIEVMTYSQIVNLVTLAVRDEDVKRIHLDIYSPGGAIADLLKAVNAVWAARHIKPVTAHIEDLGAAAAYLLASQAKQVTAGLNALVGDIGLFMVYKDTSRAFAKKGLKTVLVRSGSYKGIGVPGAKISNEQISGVQEIIDGLMSNFVSMVARGRGLNNRHIQKYAGDGKIFIAKRAKELGLIDTVI